MPQPAIKNRANRQSPFLGRPPECVAYQTTYGRMLHGQTEELLKAGFLDRFECSAQLFCPFGRLEIVRHVPRVFHEPVSQ